MKQLTFGSLFAGVGGFDMGFEQAGWKCKFQVEWDKNCQNILNKHWPDVPKWGDVSEVDGAIIPPVDCIVFGSPCQDLSLAGKRKGLEGERSGLFHQATRIIKEMRYATNGTFPRWAVWENVAGALSSNRGADFATVLHQMGEAGAVEQWWNILDAQFFGVPQRRRRLFLVACLDPATAARCPEALLPVAESLPGHLEKSAKKRQSASREASESVGADGSVIGATSGSSWWDGRDTTSTLTGRSDGQRMPDKGHLNAVVQEVMGCLSSSDLMKGQTSHQSIDVGLLQVVETDEAPICIDRSAFNQGPNAMYDTHISDDPVVPTLVSRGPHAVFTKSRRAQSSTDDESWVEGAVNPTLNAFDMGDTRTTTAVVEPIYFNDDRRIGPTVHGDVIPTLQAFMGTGGNNTPMVATPVEQTAYAFDSLSSNSMKSANPDSGVNEIDVAKTLDTWRPDPSLNQGGVAIVEDATVLFENSYRDGARIAKDGVTQTLSAKMGTGGGNTPMVAVTYSFDTQFGSNANVTEDIAPTLKASQQSPSIAYPIQDGREMEKNQNGFGVGDGEAPSYTLTATGGQAVAYPIDTRNALRDPEKFDAQNRQGLGVGADGDPMATLTSAHVNAVAYSIREDAKADTFSATELDHANALSALRPSPQSHHAQMFITETLPVATEPMVFQPGSMLRLGHGVQEGLVPTLRAEAKQGDNSPHIQIQNSEPSMAVRRLTPLECERLMGWPDDHTRWKADGTEQADSHRYKQCGNGVASPVAKWIGKQIAKVEHE